ncbi:hypothetical protein C8J57DRAFT_1706583 [Mycena rebaudengoi]|nr:hypothetical protein C8J57DRAFT_1706583 [Mycena rebaudengoi]
MSRPSLIIATFRWLCDLLRIGLAKFKGGLVILRLILNAGGHFRAFIRIKPHKSLDTMNKGAGPLTGYPSEVLGSGVNGQDQLEVALSAHPTSEGFDVSGAGPSPTSDISTASHSRSPDENRTAASQHNEEPQIEPSTPSTMVHATPDTVLQDGIQPIFPESFQRYGRNVTIPRQKDPYPIDIEPHTFNFDAYDADDPPNSGWLALTHPEGARYFFHPRRRIFTDAPIYKRDVLAEVQTAVDYLVQDIERSPPRNMAPYAALLESASEYVGQIDLVIDLTLDSNGGKSEVGYYFINHSTRSPFWAHSQQIEDNLFVWTEIDGPIETKHLRHEMEHQYWKHCAFFPIARPLTKECINELQDGLLHSIADMSTSLTSTVSLTIEELKNRLYLVGHMQYDRVGSATAFARIMSEFARERFYHFHGLACARLDRDQSVYDDSLGRRSYLITILSPILFYAPDVHLYSLEKAYVDKIIYRRVWQEVVQKLNKEWEEFTLLATVVLNANVGFLSIQSVDQGNGQIHHPPFQIASYLSTLASTGSIILGLLLVRQNRTKFRDSSEEISLAMRRRSSTGLELLAIIFSLPYALLMWSIVCFVFAFLSMCLRAPDILTRLPVGVVATAISMLIFWCIWDAWGMTGNMGTPFWSAWASRVRATLSYVVSAKERPYYKFAQNRWKRLMGVPDRSAASMEMNPV